MKNELKEIDIKNRACYYFDDYYGCYYGLFNKVCDKIKYLISKKVVLHIVLIIILERSELTHLILYLLKNIDIL